MFTYFIQVTNNGTDPAFKVVVRDVLPAERGLRVRVGRHDPATATSSAREAAHVVTCTGGTLDGSADLIPDDPATPGSTRTCQRRRTISIVVRAPAADSIAITNQAFIDPTNAIAESNETNNQAFENDQRSQSPFNLTLEKEGPNQAQPEQRRGLRDHGHQRG